MGGHPLTLAPSLYGSGASLVSDAGATAEDQFRVQRLLIQAELEDLNQALLTAATTLELWDSLTPDDSGEG